MSVILNVDDKVKTVIGTLPKNYTEEEFYEAFVKMFPKDYEKCKRKYIEEDRKTKPGKTHPMQPPKKHIVNALKSYLSRHKDNMSCERE